MSQHTEVDTETDELAIYRAFGERMHQAFAVLSPELEISWASPNFTTMLGHRLDELRGRTVLDLVHPDDLSVILPMAMEVLGAAADVLERPANARAVELNVRVLTATGEWFPTSISGRVLDTDGRLMCTIRPAAEQHALAAVLDQLGGGAGLGEVLGSVVGLLRAQFDLHEAALVHDFDGHAVVVGAPGAVAGDPDGVLARLRDDEVLSPEIRCDGDRWLLPVLAASRERLYGAFSLVPPRDDDPRPYDAFVGGRTCHLASLAFAGAETTRSLLRAATHDHLTGATSRREFELQLERIVPRDELPVAVLFVDLDGFKGINDTFGHHHGDQVLRAVAGRLAHAVQAGDTVARLGGDEFAILCRRLPERAVGHVVGRIAALFDDPIELEPGFAVVTSASIGVGTARYPNQLDGLLRRADADMYQAKRDR